MFNMLFPIQFVTTCVLLILLLGLFRNRLTSYYVLLFVSAVITVLGYMQVANSATLEQALAANQIVYLGASFSPTMLVLSLSALCKEPINKWVKTAMIATGVLIFILVSTSGVSTIYYKSLSLSLYHGVTVLDRTYGPLHILYPLYLAADVLAGFILIFRAFRKKSEVSFRTSMTLLLTMILMVLIYLVEKVAHLKLEILPFGYIIAQISILLLLRRISLYDVAALSASAMMDSMSNGFIILDADGKFLGSDAAAKKWFPEVAELEVDRPIPFSDSLLLSKVRIWASGLGNNESEYLERDGRYFELVHSVSRARRGVNVHTVYISDNTEKIKYIELVKSYNEELEREVEAKTERLRRMQSDINASMAAIVENRDNNTGGHIKRTSDVVALFTKHLLKTGQFALDEETAQRIIDAAPLHDFGKIAIPDLVLNKPGKYTAEEYDVMKKHPARGAAIVHKILENAEDESFRTIAENVAHFHHEKWDGSGYPDGRIGADIPFEARVMALADVFDALVSKRVYKEKYSYDKAFTIIGASCGSHFDPALCNEFLKLKDQLTHLYSTYND